MFTKPPPLVSIIIPVYNAGSYLRPSLISIVNQTYNNLQIIIINDGSTDYCLDTIKDVVDERIIILHQPNSGKSVAMNRALELAQGTYYAIQDADDLSTPDRIKELVEVLENFTHLGAVFSGYNILLNTEPFAPIYKEKNEISCKLDIELVKMPSHDPTGMYRLSAVKNIRFDSELNIGQGYDYILKVGEKHPMRVIAKCLYSYRIDINSTTRNNNDRRTFMIKKVWEKSCLRRGIDYKQWLIINHARLWSLQRGTNRYGIVPHCMESVVCLKKDNMIRKAIKVAFFCLMIQPFNINFYKPLLYAISPLNLITLFRYLKKQLMPS